MADSSYFLRVHPIEVSLLPCIAPRVQVSSFGQRKTMILTQGDVNYFLVLQGFHVFWIIELDVVLVAMAQHSPIPVSKSIDLTFLTDHSRVSLANKQPSDIQVIKHFDSLWISFWHG